VAGIVPERPRITENDAVVVDADKVSIWPEWLIVARQPGGRASCTDRAAAHSVS